MKEILLLTIGFSPNIGGIETHFDDLTKVLERKKIKTWVITYKPLTTKVKAAAFESKGEFLKIFRLPMIRGVFYKFVKTPAIEFLFLTPLMFLFLPIFLIFKGSLIKTIHTHGLIAGFSGVFWGKLLGKRVIATTHSIYNFPSGLNTFRWGDRFYRSLAKWIFNSSDTVLALSKQSKDEIVGLGVEPKKIKVFTYWIDLGKFKAIGSKQKAKIKVGWKGKFIVLFVGRLVAEKGIMLLLEAAKNWDKNITLVIAGSGPLESNVKTQMSNVKNIIYLGKVDNDDLPKYYNAADLLIVPSIHEEGFGRVILESLACRTPVIGSNRGAIPEAMDERVGKLIQVSPENIKKSVEFFFNNPDNLKKLTNNTHKYAISKYSDKNANAIVDTYA